eukprot:8884527-Karenia_brevis.AAC.1
MSGRLCTFRAAAQKHPAQWIRDRQDNHRFLHESMPHSSAVLNSRIQCDRHGVHKTQRSLDIHFPG